MLYTPESLDDAQNRDDASIESFLEPHADHIFSFAGYERPLHVALQPKIDSTGEIVGVEALLRTVDADTVPQDLLMDVRGTERSAELLLTVLEQACTHAEELDLHVAVNIPADELNHNTLQRIITVLAAHPDVSHHMELEIIEDHPITNEEQIQTLKALAETGVTLSLDDFGSGYATMEALTALSDQGVPIHTVKIDKSHVDAGNAAEVARELLAKGYTVVVEGVETEEQHRLLPEACIVQGHLHGRARPAASYRNNLH